MTRAPRDEDRVPLARLLAMAYRELVDGLHERLRARGYADVRPAYGYVLLAVRERPRTGVELAELLGVTKQAAAKLIETMEAGGYVTRAPHGEDARAKLVTLTREGKKFLGVVEAIWAELEAEWSVVTSERRVEALRNDLTAILRAAHGGALPPVRPTG